MAAAAAGPAPCLQCQLQAYGAKAYTVLGQVWQRAVLIMGLLCLPIAALWLSIGRLLLLMGQTPAVADMTAAYMRSAACTAAPVLAHKDFAWPWLCVSPAAVRGRQLPACWGPQRLPSFGQTAQCHQVSTMRAHYAAMEAGLLQPLNDPLPCAAGDCPSC